MGIFKKRIDTAYATRPSVPHTPVSPWGSQSSLQVALESDLFGTDSKAITRDIALRVPGLKRAVQIHADVVAAMPLVQYKDGAKAHTQPRWLQNSNSGIPPLIRTKGLVKDLALEGWALLGCEVTTDGTIEDAIHIPKATHWQFTGEGVVEFTKLVDPRYLGKLVLIPLGDNGILIDGVDTIRQARALDLARTVRLESPPAGTELHVNDPAYDSMSKKERMREVTAYAEQRRKTSVSMTPSYLDVKEHSGEAIDLFDSATNSVRLDIANHASVPASLIEGAKATGGGDMNYTGKGDERSELYDLGSRQFADAISARLSLDDICPQGEYIAFDTSEMFAVPTPTTPPVRED